MMKEKERLLVIWTHILHLIHKIRMTVFVLKISHINHYIGITCK